MTEEPDSTTLDESRGALLREFVALEAPKCPVCAYDLAGLRGAACPECGTALKLQVGAAESRLGMWVATVVGVSVAGGGAAMLLSAVATISIWERNWPRREFFILVIYPALISATSLLAAAALGRRRGRRWFQRLSPSSARWQVALGLAWPVAATAIFLIVVLNM